MKTKTACFIIALIASFTAYTQIIITEIHYNPFPSRVHDSIAGSDFFEFIELKNIGDSRIDLSHAIFTKGISFLFEKHTYIEPEEYVIICNNKAVFSYKYTDIPVAGEFIKGKLSNSGEHIVLQQDEDTLINFSYTDTYPWPIMPDGMGFSLTLRHDSLNIHNPKNWRASHKLGGTPGRGEETTDIPHITINKVIANTNCPNVDTIELYNPTTQRVNIGGWYLTDNDSYPTKWKIPDPTYIEAQSTLTFSAGVCYGSSLHSTDSQFGSAFTLEASGDEIYIFSAHNRKQTGYAHGFRFGETKPNEQSGRIVTSDSQEFLVPVIATKSGNTEFTPLNPSLAITEIKYNSFRNEPEYIQITNTTSDTIFLDNWIFRAKDINFDTAQLHKTYCLPDSSFYIIQSPFSADEFKNKHTIAASTPVYYFSGELDNNAHKLYLEKKSPALIHEEDTILPHRLIDIVSYRNTKPWPYIHSGMNASIIRKNVQKFGSEPTNWVHSDTPLPKAIAGKNQIIEEGATIYLNGTQSYDPNEITDSITYHWKIIEKPAGSSASLNNPQSAQPTFICDASGAFIMSLTVSNGLFYSKPDTVYVYEQTYYNSQTSTSVSEHMPTIYPTLSGGTFNFSAHSIIEQYIIRNIKGNTIQTKNIHSTQGTIHISQPGTFFITLCSKEQYKTITVYVN
ncbi:MAG: lamin tail domain-containing protein [Bacteroidales bacterium]